MTRIMIRHHPARPAMSSASPANFNLCTQPSPDQAAALDLQCFADPWDSRAYGELLANPCVEVWISLAGGKKAAKEGKTGGGEPAGLLCFLVAGDEMELYRIGVQPKFRGRGLALDLLHRLVGESLRRQTAGIHLEVRKGNQPARNLYARGGFEECGLRAGYYSHPMEDAVLYRLALPREDGPIPGPDSG